MGTLVEDEYYFTQIHGIRHAAKEASAWTMKGVSLPEHKKTIRLVSIHKRAKSALKSIPVSALPISITESTMKRVLFVVSKTF